MAINIEEVTAEEHANLDRIFKMSRALIIFTGETAEKHQKELEEIARLRGKSLDSRSAYDLTKEALKYLDKLVNPPGFQLGLSDLPRGKDRSLTLVLGWSKYDLEGAAGIGHYHELTTEKGQSIHENYCRILEMPRRGREDPLAKLFQAREREKSVGGIRPTGGG